MFRGLTSVLVLVFAVSSYGSIEQSTSKSITLRVFKDEFTKTNADLLDMVKAADLEGRGFEKEEGHRMLSTDEATNKSAYNITTLNYFKIVECSKVMEFMVELEELLPGVLGASMDTAMVKAMKDKSLDTVKECKAGVEIPVKVIQSHTPNNIQGFLRRFAPRNRREIGVDGGCCCSKCSCSCCCCKACSCGCPSQRVVALNVS